MAIPSLAEYFDRLSRFIAKISLWKPSRHLLEAVDSPQFLVAAITMISNCRHPINRLP
jgi:hypothetical protein